MRKHLLFYNLKRYIEDSPEKILDFIVAIPFKLNVK